MENLNEKTFVEWFKEHSPHIGKGKTMEAIVAAFSESSFPVQQSYPPFGMVLYNTQAAKLMNKLKEEGKIKTYKKGNAYCYEWIEEDKE